MNGKIENGYLVILEGLARIRIDRFTLTGTPFFEAQVKAFPRRPGEFFPAIRGPFSKGCAPQLVCLWRT